MADWLPKIYWTEGEISAFLLQLEIAWSGFASDLQNNPSVFNADELDQFEMLDQGYATWKKGINNWWDRQSGGTVSAAKAYAKQLKYWTDLFNQRTGGKLTGAGVSLIVPDETSGPLFAANFTPELMSKESTDKIQTIVVAICVAVGLSAIARTIRG